jgi:hypothetical protein
VSPHVPLVVLLDNFDHGSGLPRVGLGLPQGPNGSPTGGGLDLPHVPRVKAHRDYSMGPNHQWNGSGPLHVPSEPPTRGSPVMLHVRTITDGTGTSTSALQTPARGGMGIPRLHALSAPALRSCRDTTLPCGLWRMTKAVRHIRT